VSERSIIWACPSCDHWQWGDSRDPLDQCAECGADMSRVEPDRECALETLYCRRFHERNEANTGISTGHDCLFGYPAGGSPPIMGHSTPYDREKGRNHETI
jgi:hypothetical protein